MSIEKELCYDNLISSSSRQCENVNFACKKSVNYISMGINLRKTVFEIQINSRIRSKGQFCIVSSSEQNLQRFQKAKPLLQFI